jgi:hypothetical protein
MTKYLHSKALANGWFEVHNPEQPLGVLLRQSSGRYMTEPKTLSSTLTHSIDKLRFEVALTISTEATEAILDVLKDNDDEIQDVVLGNGSQLQVVESLSDLVRDGLTPSGRLQRAVLVKEERVLLAWHDDVDKLLVQMTQLEGKLLEIVSLELLH